MESIPAGRPTRSATRIRGILSAFLLLAIPLCFAAVPREKHLEAEATLYFFNTSGWKAIPEKLTLLDNGQKIAALNREQYVVLSIAPGQHVFKPKGERPSKGAPKHEVDLDAKSGLTYYVAGGFTPEMHSFRWTFREISKSDADELAAKMKLQAKN